jgi:hypothetical protein
MGRGFFLKGEVPVPYTASISKILGWVAPSLHPNTIFMNLVATSPTPNLCRATLRMLVAFPLCSEGGFNDITFLAEPTMVWQGQARAVLAFFDNCGCLAANLTVYGFENSLYHCHANLDAGSKPFDSLPASATGGGFRPRFPWLC